MYAAQTVSSKDFNAVSIQAVSVKLAGMFEILTALWDSSWAYTGPSPRKREKGKKL